MKKNLVLLFVLSTLFSLNPLFSQTPVNRKPVFMIDPRVDLVKLGTQRSDALSISISTKNPIHLISASYNFDQALNKIIVPNSRIVSALPIDPSTATFFIREKDGKFAIVTYDPDKVSFMGPDGEEFVPFPNAKTLSTARFSLSEFSENFFERGGIKQSVTNENTTANLQIKDRKGGSLLGQVNVPTNKPKVIIKCNKFPSRDNVEYEVSVPDEAISNFDATGRRIPGPGLRNIMFIDDPSDLNTGVGQVINKAKLLGDKLIELNKQCAGVNQPNFCTTNDIEARELLGIELKKIPGFESLDFFFMLPGGLSNIK